MRTSWKFILEVERPLDKIAIIREVLGKYAHFTGQDPRSGHSIVVDIAGAQTLLKAIFVQLPIGVFLTDDPDELFCVDGIPVRLRFTAPLGQAFVMMDMDIPKQTCCDSAALSTILICMSRGST
jgi:hypothetical protein